MTNHQLLPGFDPLNFINHTETYEIFLKTQEMLEKFLGVRAAIERDLESNGMKKKSVRNATKQNQMDQMPSLPNLNIEDSEPVSLRLKEGRPRMPVDLVLFFLMLRGKWDSVCDLDTYERLSDSVTIQAILAHLGIKKIPSGNTIRENLNAVSNETRFLIFRTQAAMIIDAELDDFSEVLIDSTAVAGNTAYPTDISILFKLLDRIEKCFVKLEEFGFSPSRGSWPATRLDKMKKYLKYISLNAGKKGVKGKVKIACRKFLALGDQLIGDFLKEQKHLCPLWEDLNSPPVDSLAIDKLWYKIDADIEDAINVLRYAELYVNDNIKLPSTDKLLSISDPSVGYIQKGQRVPVIGYKPQIARSGNGFVCGLVVPEGNAADSAMLIPTFEQVLQVTGVTPYTISTDDGYAAFSNVQTLKDAGVVIVSISGAKGKNILGNDWECLEYVDARNKRSAVESGMFTLKYNNAFGQLRRRGIDAVRAELMEKVLAYNFQRMIKIEAKIRKEKTEQELRKLRERQEFRQSA